MLLSFLVAFAVAEVAVRLISPQESGAGAVCLLTRNWGRFPCPANRGSEGYPGVYRFRTAIIPWGGAAAGNTGRRSRPITGCSFWAILLPTGLGVNDDQTFAALVEKELRADRMSVEVMNAGCPGKGTDYELKCFQTVGRKFHPDLTVLGFFANDFQDNARGEYYNIGRRGELQVKPLDCNRGAIKTVLDRLPAYNWLLSWSQAANLVKQAGVKVLINRAQQDQP